ncbi:MAG: mechanosensitive ion channel, partial [Chitinispirillaceae bacterium]|nr:mechanosensitive ion channel [Chitinispirillaceae bacterium]
MLNKMRSGGTIESMEMEKRVETMTHILISAFKLAVWIIAGMLLLRKLGIDIAPLIAGAGIVGLALGFGAQEMVRDMISGFFMLLENQVR